MHEAQEACEACEAAVIEGNPQFREPDEFGTKSEVSCGAGDQSLTQYPSQKTFNSVSHELKSPFGTGTARLVDWRKLSNGKF